ncbi:MAG: tRNA lysidine(34) synthetase TilS [Bacteroidetes bacterium]|nr:tRNA lysidine(34) synthetase TilS [Bacteroidota bacterium]MCL5025062.1 tRNA lysidine(34) synthetase TilS [Chloroflexota bacterium]
MSRKHDLLRKVKTAIDGRQMAARGDLWLVAVSGGADSVALLHALYRLSPELGLRLHVAHLDHGLRGRAAEADAAFVEGLAHELDLPVTVGRRDVRRLRRTLGLGLEAAARLTRYAFLAQTAAEVGAAGAALGHTADDQAETLLLHCLRGTGLGGRQGMLPLSELSGTDPERPQAGRWQLRLFRPLLDITRAEVEEYCRSEGLQFCTDASNYDRTLRRNWVRRELLPLLEEHSPGAKKALARSARLAAQDLEYLQGKVSALWPALARLEGERVVFDLAAWKRLHPVEQRYLLREAMRRLAGSVEDLSEAHIEAARRTMTSGAVGATVAWPRGVRLVKGYDEFALEGRPLDEPDEGPDAFPPLDVEIPLSIPGATVFGPWRITAELRDRRCSDADPWHADLDYRTLDHGLSVRGRRPGDRLQPLGIEGEVKLQDLMVNAKIPRAERNSWPVVVSSGRIIWVPGCRIAHWARVISDTLEVLCLRASRDAP